MEVRRFQSMKKIIQILKLILLFFVGMMFFGGLVEEVERYIWCMKEGMEVGDEKVGIILCVVVLCICLFFSIRILLKDRCPECKKLWALEVEDEVLINKENISVLTEVHRYNRWREVIETNEQYIPGTRRKYKVCYVCKYCGEKCYDYKTVDSTNV